MFKNSAFFAESYKMIIGLIGEANRLANPHNIPSRYLKLSPELEL